MAVKAQTIKELIIEIKMLHSPSVLLVHSHRGLIIKSSSSSGSIIRDRINKWQEHPDVDTFDFLKDKENQYDVIILDPPAYGHGPNGEKWKLENNINEMITHVLQLLDDEEHFLILNAYSLGFSSMIIENLLKNKAKEKLETGELFLEASTGSKLPLGVFGRFRSY